MRLIANVRSMLVLLLVFSSMTLTAPLAGAEELWSSQTSMPTPRVTLATATLDNKVYAAGGIPTTLVGTVGAFEMFDPDLNTWSSRTNMPTPRWGLGLAAANGKIYAIGGTSQFGFATETALNVVEEFDPTTNSWTTKTPLPTARWSVVAATVNGKIYVIGGYTANNVYSAVVEQYDPLTNSWTARQSMPSARAYGAAASLNGKIYVMGGRSTAGEFLQLVEEYDPATNTWTQKLNMPTGRYGLGLAAVNNRLYAVGGNTSSATTVLKVVEEFDPALNSWRSRVPLTIERYGLGVAATQTSVFAIGGIRNNQQVTGAVEKYTPTPPLSGRIFLPTSPQALESGW